MMKLTPTVLGKIAFAPVPFDRPLKVLTVKPLSDAISLHTRVRVSSEPLQWYEIWPDHVTKNLTVKTCTPLAIREAIYDYRLEYETRSGVVRVGAYEDARTKILHRCACGEEFPITPDHAVRGVRCMECGILASAQKRSRPETDEELIAYAKTFEFLSDFFAADSATVDLCYRRRLMDKISFKPKNYGDYHCVYVIYNQMTNQAYIGVTSRAMSVRIMDHKSAGNSTNSKLIAHLEDTVFEQLTDYIYLPEDIDKNGPMRIEHVYYEKYKSFGFAMLNSETALGCVRSREAKYTREYCAELAADFLTVVEFKKAHSYAYAKINLKKWKDLIVHLKRQTRLDMWRSSARVDVWLAAGKLFELWNQLGQCGKDKLSTHSEFEPGALKVIVENFRADWIPSNDAEWLEWCERQLDLTPIQLCHKIAA